MDRDLSPWRFLWVALKRPSECCTALSGGEKMLLPKQGCIQNLDREHLGVPEPEAPSQTYQWACNEWLAKISRAYWGIMCLFPRLSDVGMYNMQNSLRRPRNINKIVGGAQWQIPAANVDLHLMFYFTLGVSRERPNSDLYF